jgi:hypothetical protein
MNTPEQKQNNQTAFPIINSGTVYESGMTLRDYFAAKAMQGLLSSGKLHPTDTDYCCALSYEMADAMLKAKTT